MLKFSEMIGFRKVVRSTTLFVSLVAAGCGATLGGSGEDSPGYALPDQPVGEVPLGPDGCNAAADSYLVVYAEGQTQDEFNVPGDLDLIEASGGKIHENYFPELEAISATIPESALKQLRTRTHIKYIERNCQVQMTASSPRVAWGLDRIDQRTRPLDNAVNISGTGKGVSAYVIDTGIRTSHEQFSGRAFPLYTSILDGRGVNDCHGHGTHVAGTIGGYEFGVAKEVTLFGVRVLGCDGSGTTASVISGIRAVIRHHRMTQRPAVANMSIGGPASDAMDRIIQRGIQEGITFAVAAGNEKQDACLRSPARARDALTVGATNSQDVAADFSNWGSCVDIHAPGVDIPSAWISNDDADAVLSGTSMATPHVAGAAALYLADHPSAMPREVAAELMNQATRGVVAMARSTPDPKLLFVGTTSPSVVQVANHYQACGISRYAVFQDTSITLPPLRPGHRALLSNALTGNGLIGIDDEMTFSCQDIYSDGALVPGTERTLSISSSRTCASISVLPPADATSLFSTTRSSRCRMVFQDLCGSCMGNSSLYLSFVK